MLPPRELPISVSAMDAPTFDEFSALPGAGDLSDYFIFNEEQPDLPVPDESVQVPPPSALPANNQQQFIYEAFSMNIPIHGQSQDAYSFQDPSIFQPALWNPQQQYYGDYYQPLLQQPVWNQSLAPQDIYQTQYYGYQQPVPMNQPIVAKESEDFQFPSIIMTGLAALNARRPISTQDAYSFIKKHWPRFRYDTSKWKNNIRHKLTDRPFFTKVAGISMLKSGYVFNKENPGWLQREIERMERRRRAQGLSLDCYGLEDTGVWQSMVAGTLGLPPFVSSDARLSSVRKTKAPKAVPRNVQQQNQMVYPNQQYFYPPAVQGPLMQ